MTRQHQTEMLPPHAIDVERTVLGSMIIVKEIAYLGSIELSRDLFYTTANQLIFDTLKTMVDTNIPIDLTTLKITCEGLNILETVGDEVYLSELVENLCTVGNFPYYVKILRTKEAERKLLELAGSVMSGISTDENIQALLETASTSLNIIQKEFNGFHRTKTVFSWGFPVDTSPPQIKFRETGILWNEGICLLTGPAGKGKTNILLAATVSALNPDADTIGLKIMCERILYVDTENQKMIFHRNIRRALINRAGLTEGDDLKGVQFVNIREQETFIEKQNWLWETIQSEEFEIIIIDGIGDMVLDLNDTETCIMFISKLSAMISKHHCSVVVTLHGNPMGQATEKARGVLGSELLRKCDSSILLKVDKKSRSITTDFALGKNRAEKDKLTQYFEWDGIQEMHVSCEPPKKELNEFDGEQLEEFNNDVLKFINNKGRRRFKEITSYILQKYELSERTAARRVTDMVNRQFITKFHGFYFDEQELPSNEEFFQPLTKFIEENEKVSKKAMISTIVSEYEVSEKTAKVLLTEFLEAENQIIEINNTLRINKNLQNRKIEENEQL